MDYEFDDCYDEIEYIDDIDIDYTVIRDIQQKKQKIKRQNKKVTRQIKTDNINKE
jgi:hypothetical protein